MRNTLPKTVTVEFTVRQASEPQSFIVLTKRYKTMKTARKVANKWLSECLPNESRQVEAFRTRIMWIKTVEKNSANATKKEKVEVTNCANKSVCV